jgi:hypothetical protein
MPPLQQLQAHILRNGPMGSSLPGSPFLHHTGFLHGSPFAAHQSLYMPPHLHSLNLGKQDVRRRRKTNIDCSLEGMAMRVPGSGFMIDGRNELTHFQLLTKFLPDSFPYNRLRWLQRHLRAWGL